MENPDADDFEQIYADELELLQAEQHAEQIDFRPRSKRSLDFSRIFPPCASSERNTDVGGGGVGPLEFSSIPQLGTPSQWSTGVTNSDVEHSDANQESLNAKRRIKDLFSDISGIEREKGRTDYAPKRAKVMSDEELIENILSLRKAARDAAHMREEEETKKLKEKMKGTVSRRIPSGPFETLVCGENIKLYVKRTSEVNFDAQVRSIIADYKNVGLLSVPYSTLRDRALDYLEKKERKEDSEQSEATMEVDSGCEAHSEDEDIQELWAEKYKPKRYLDLLSDETCNRTLLRWVMLWDKVAFNRESQIASRRRKKYSAIAILDEHLDKNNCPKQKIALLSGPPGLGKTTLAQVVAKHAGYRVVEMNASDDRSPEAFALQLEAATQMKAVMGKDPRPNCLVLDEIDGAPAAAIDLLVKFVTAQDSGGKGKKKKQNFILKRPIICICNDLYVPTLRPLRQIALVIQMPLASSARIAQRLMHIARRRGIKTNTYALLALAEKTSNDIRSCLAALQLFKAFKKPISLADVVNADTGMKDMYKGPFQVWQEVFQVTRPKWYTTNGQKDVKNYEQVPLKNLPLSVRMRNTLQSVQSCGDFERLAQGVFENYPKMKFWDSQMKGVSASLEWFCDVDCMYHHMHSTMNYASLAYIPYAFVQWHFTFASTSWPNISYPSAGYEASVKKSRGKQVLSQLVSGMSPGVRIYNNEHSLVLETLPLLLHILSPDLPPINVLLYTPKQKQDMHNVIRIMLEYNLRYTQERSTEGEYDYVLDPNLGYVVRFSQTLGCPNVSYLVKQLIAREVHFGSIKKNENTGKGRAEVKDAATNSATSKHSKRVRIKSKADETNLHRMTDFFQYLPADPSQPLKPHEVMLKDLSKCKVWYHFKEGFSNAIRKPVKMRDLFL